MSDPSFGIVVVEDEGHIRRFIRLALESEGFQVFEADGVRRGLIEAAEAIGATPGQIITKVLIPESLPGIVAGFTVTLVSLIGYSAMAGTVGGGGLGDLGIRFGYQRFMPEVMATVVIILILLVQGLQSLGDWLTRRLSHR